MAASTEITYVESVEKATWDALLSLANQATAIGALAENAQALASLAAKADELLALVADEDESTPK